MSILFWIPFLFASPPPDGSLSSPANPSCTTRGPLLLEIREGSDTTRSMTTTKIFASGAWTVTTGRSHSERGCFDRRELRAIRSAVQRAPWQITSRTMACFAYDPSFTEYFVRGTLRYTARMCSGETADAETLQAIALVNAELAEDRRPSTPPVSMDMFAEA